MGSLSICLESNGLRRKVIRNMTMPGEAAVLDAVQMPGRYQVRVDRTRDALLTDFGRATLTDRYLMPGEEFQDLFARVASQYGDNQAHAQRLYDYMSKLWFMPSTPVPTWRSSRHRKPWKKSPPCRSG